MSDDLKEKLADATKDEARDIVLEEVKKLKPTTEEVIDAMPDGPAKKHMKLMQKREALHPDLAPYVDDSSDSLGPWLKHPLMYGMLGNPGEDGFYPFAAHLNAGYERKLEAMEEAYKQENWFVIIHVFYERPYRLLGFSRIEEHLSDEQWWDLLGGIWTDSENIYECPEWDELLRDERPGRENMMEDWERERLDALPDEITVYRGYTYPERRDAHSWTLDRVKAEWFAKRLNSPEDPPPMVATGTVKKEHVLAFFDGRQENEIVVLPEHIDLKEDEEL